jgi:signal transduction histidine kinase
MSAIVYAIFCISFILISGIYILFYKSPFIDIENLPKNTNIYIYLAISLIIGLVLSIFFRKYVLIPLHESYIALGKVADGKFDIRVNEKGIRSVRKVTKSLNITARELNNLESMRNDFINNFSHEFKTPIVSISGFAKLLKNPELSPQEKEEYLDIIINESERLSQLSANVLNLTRLDNQSILTGISRFNVSEQIRHTVILLENKWSAKNIDITFDSDDYSIFANSELLSQLWINLLDNAIKFSPAKTEIKIAVSQNGSDLIFTFSDQGKGMDENTAKHAFDKFFQGDISHKSNGTGIGLAISKRICELHGGNITIKSTGENGTVFEVIIPIES